MIEEGFKQAEREWRSLLELSYPLFSDVRLDSSFEKEKRMWHFSTDGRSGVTAHLHQPKKVEKLARKCAELHRASGNEIDDKELLKEAMKYVLIHECPGHWEISPESVEDRKFITKAIYQGMMRRYGDKKVALKKTANLRNLVLDLVEDVQIFHSFKLQDGIIPSFDYIEVLSSKDSLVRNALYPLTRVVYSLLTRNQTLRKKFVDFFLSATPLADARTRALRILGTLGLKVKDPYLTGEMHERALKELVDVLGSRDSRYKAIEDFSLEVADLVPIDMKVGRRSEDEGGGASDVLNDLLDVLGQDELNDLLSQLASEDEPQLSILAADEFYKRNSERIDIRSPTPQIRSRVLGEKERWKLVNSNVLSTDELARTYDLNQLLDFQRRTGLPVLLKLGPNIWRVNEYKLKKTPLKSYTWEPTGILLPDWVVFWIDSSGSMATGQVSQTPSYVGSGNKFDRLQRVLYGILRGLREASRLMGHELRVGVVNYSHLSLWSGFHELTSAYDEHLNEFKELLLKPQWEETVIEPEVVRRVESELGEGKCVHVIISDGDLQQELKVSRVKSYFKEIAGRKDRGVVFVEIKDSGVFGDFMRGLARRPNVYFMHVDEIEEISNLKEILIRYERVSKFYA
jgi:hypothetical protein